MPYLSEMLDRPVADASGQEVGRLVDLIVPADVDYPAVAAAVLRGDAGERTIPWEALRLEENRLALKTALEQAGDYRGSEQDLHLRRQVLDRQIIDINGARVVRVNDLQLARTNDAVRLVSVDISTRDCCGGWGWSGRSTGCSSASATRCRRA